MEKDKEKSQNKYLPKADIDMLKNDQYEKDIYENYDEN